MIKPLFFRKQYSSLAACLLLLFAAVCSQPVVCRAQTLDTGAWVTNGTVRAIVSDASYTYMGGNFTYVGPNTGSFVKFTNSSATPNTAFPTVNFSTFCVAADGAGGWYIGGNFNRVGSFTRTRLAHILSDGTVDTAWDPAPNGGVSCMAVSGAYVYVGGSFTTIGGQPMARIARLNSTTGAVDNTWNPGCNNNVLAMAISGANIYIGGFFTSAGGQTRNRIAKLNNTNGNADATWNANANGNVRSLAVDGANIYAGGGFSSIGGQTKNRIAKLNNTNGNADATWSPEPNDAVYTIAIDGTAMYVGGAFTTIGGQTRNRIAKLNIANGSADATWNPNIDASVFTVVVNGAYVYAGGLFTTIGGQARANIARLNTTTGAADVDWSVNLGGGVNAIAISGVDIYIGGDFRSIGGVRCGRISRIDNATGIADANWAPNANGEVLALALDGTDLYAGGAFTDIGGTARSYIAKINTTNGNVDATWNANSDNSVNSVIVSGGAVYAGGAFYTIGGLTRNRIAKLNTTTGAAYTNWNANANSTVRCLAANGPDIYAGGDFYTIGGLARAYIAKLDTATGAADATWNGNANHTVFAMATSGTAVYAGGNFTNIGGMTRNRIAKLNTTTGTADNIWNPSVPGIVYALLIKGIEVYAGGNFTSTGLLRANGSTGSGDVFMSAINDQVYALAAVGPYVYIGGMFSSVATVSQPYIARVTVPTFHTWTGATSNSWNTASNWSTNAVPRLPDTVVLPSGTPYAPDLVNASYATADLTVNAGQVLTLGTGDITVTGSFINNGTIAGTGKVVLNGTTAQNIEGTGAVGNIELNNASGATVAAGSNKLNITGLLSLTVGTLTTNGNVVLKSTSPTATAMVGPVLGAISGNVAHERYLGLPGNGSGGRSWRLLTSPVSNATDTSVFYHWQNNGVNDGTGLELFSPAGTGAAGNGLAGGGVNPSIRSYNYLTNSYVPLTNTKTTALFSGGLNNTFQVFACGHYGSGNITGGAGATNTDAAGTLITGTKNYSFTAPSATNIYYLMGNPYACPIDFNKVYSNAGTANIKRMFWVIDPALSNVGAYATVSYVGSSYVTSTGSQNQYIQTGQGFFVEATTPNVLSTIAIEENDKETAAAQTAMFRTNGGNLETFRVKLYKNINSVATLLDGTVVAAHQAANNAIDGVDGKKFGNFNENIGIMTAGKVLAIDARQLLDNNDTVHVSLSSMQQTAYQLVFEPGNMGSANLAATLIDNFNNTTTPIALNGNTTYNFTVTSNPLSTGANRFKVAFLTISPLSIKFVSASAVKREEKVDVQWTVADQEGISFYEVEKSIDGKSFAKIAIVQASSDDAYDHTDETPVNGNNYYRIKAVARSSHGVYSNVVRVNMNAAGAELSAYPNPVRDGHLQISVANMAKGNYTISLYNSAGQRSATRQIAYDAGSTMIEMNISNLANGIYLMNLSNENGETVAEQKIVKQ